MRNITIKIEGEFWDYLIKYNELILWTFDGKIEIYDWQRFIIDLSVKTDNYKILELFQGQSVDKMKKTSKYFTVKDYYEPLYEDIQIDISKYKLKKYLKMEFESPFDDLIISIDSYKNSMFVNTDDGLYVIDMLSYNGIQKIWDRSLYDIRVGTYGKVALSAGDEGVYEYNTSEELSFNSLNVRKMDKNIYLLSNKHSNSVNWIDNYIYSTSAIEDAFITQSNSQTEENNYIDKVIGESNIFKSYKRKIHEISWASNNKLYRVYDYNKLEIVTFTKDTEQNLNFTSHFVEFMAWKGRIISGASAKFGTVVECENALVIIYNEEDVLNLKGDIIRWKIYDRYHRYNNILGIIFEDSIVLKAYDINQMDYRKIGFKTYR
ncbi:hypothetical protein [Priestia megaterium]|uniref:hypothetical protein n=1 Tax=Priestia megaterium TaxID=1404 RepID=UPI0012B745CF|nr:hypothetical protein [Priestia megaterium]